MIVPRDKFYCQKYKCTLNHKILKFIKIVFGTINFLTFFNFEILALIIKLKCVNIIVHIEKIILYPYVPEQSKVTEFKQKF